MADDEIHEDDDLDDGTPLVRKLRRDLKEASKRAQRVDELETRLAAYESEQAVRAANLDGLNERQMKALLATHEGDMTPDAIRQTAVDLGFAQPPEPAVTAEGQAAHERIAAATAGGTAPSKVNPTDVLTPDLSEDEYFAKAAELGLTVDTAPAV